ncbi:MAG: non-canonical purine NTP pyrophosphatase [archaeon]
MTREKRIIFVTGSKNKVEEAQAILSGWNVEQKEIDLPEIQSLESAEVVRAKVETAKSQVEGAFFVEDTSLHLACLNGLPGPMVRLFLLAIGREGLAELCYRLGNFSAEVKGTLGYSDGKDLVVVFQGGIRGKIVRPRGESNFGWDSIFVPDGSEESFAQMGQVEKNKVSHRKIVLDKFKNFLDNELR